MLLRFDEGFAPTDLASLDFKGDKVDLFPLTGDWRQIREISGSLEHAGVPLVEILDTAPLLYPLGALRSA